MHLAPINPNKRPQNALKTDFYKQSKKAIAPKSRKWAIFVSWWTMRKESPGKPRTATKSHRGTQPNLPTFYPLISKILLLLPFLVSENPEETPDHLKGFLIFATFQPILPSFVAISVLRSCRSCADAISRSGPRGRKERQPFATVAGGPDAPEGIQDRGTEAQHHPTKR